AVAAKAGSEGYEPLSDAQLRRFMHDDPGRGWIFRRDDVPMALTIELPPFHSCTVRTLVPTEPDVALLTALAVGGWGATQLPPVMMIAQKPVTMPGSGLVQEAHLFMLVDPDRKPLESVGAY